MKATRRASEFDPQTGAWLDPMTNITRQPPKVETCLDREGLNFMQGTTFVALDLVRLEALHDRVHVELGRTNQQHIALIREIDKFYARTIVAFKDEFKDFCDQSGMKKLAIPRK